MEVLGLHRSPWDSLPLFVCYLVTLMHTYYLAQMYPHQQQVQGPGAAAAPGSVPGAAGSNATGSSAAAAGNGSGSGWQGDRLTGRPAAPPPAPPTYPPLGEDEEPDLEAGQAPAAPLLPARPR
mmetsp:Transcript_28436/g.62574  ORF Transcript_28436/g.62574 Transcript_28436/m.62574 type:complete len:123 (+) Transcript_28436:447-815(+)